MAATEWNLKIYDSFPPLTISFSKPAISGHLFEEQEEFGWRPFLKTFFDHANLALLTDGRYFSDCVGTKNEFFDRLIFLDRRGQDSAMIVVVGDVGVGKTSFFKNLSSLRSFHSRVYLEDFNVEPEEKLDSVSVYSQGMACRLDRAVSKEHRDQYVHSLNERIIALAKNKGVKQEHQLEAFITEFKCQSKDFLTRFPTFDGQLHLSLVVASIYKITKKPVWVVLDNVDLLSRAEQDRVVNLAITISKSCQRQGKHDGRTPRIHLLVTCRTETYTTYKAGAFQNYIPMQFPSTNLIEIAKRKLSAAFTNAASYLTAEDKKSKKTPLAGLQIHGRQYSSWTAVKSEIESSLLAVIDSLEASAVSFGGWHKAVSNGNVRRFVQHWAQLLLRSDFIDEVVFVPDSERQYFVVKPHKYLSTLIKAGYPCYPGNDRFNAGVDTTNGSLVPNLFDFQSTCISNDKSRLKNYLVLLRVAQLVSLSDGVVHAHSVVELLKKFFDEHALIDAIKFLLWSRILDEVGIGVRNLGGATGWQSINADINRLELKRNSTTGFYLRELVASHEYISAISISSPLILSNKTFRVARKQSLIDSFEHAQVFYTSLLYVIVSNLEDYQEHGALVEFCDLIYHPGKEQRLWSAAVEGTLENLRSVIAAETKLNRPASRLTTLGDLLRDLEQLYEDGKNKIASIIGR